MHVDLKLEENCTTSKYKEASLIPRMWRMWYVLK